MCGRFALGIPRARLEERFGADFSALPEGYETEENVAPGRDIAVVAGPAARVEMARWGFSPPWAGTSRPIINARVETAADKPLFARAFAAGRCLVPAGGFYEWQEREGKKVPWFFAPAGEPCLALAGLVWDWPDKTGAAARAAVILTCPANADVAHIHHRMPLVVAPGDESAWLGPQGEAAAVRGAGTPAGTLVAREKAPGATRRNGSGAAAALSLFRRDGGEENGK